MTITAVAARSICIFLNKFSVASTRLSVRHFHHHDLLIPLPATFCNAARPISRCGDGGAIIFPRRPLATTSNAPPSGPPNGGEKDAKRATKKSEELDDIDLDGISKKVQEEFERVKAGEQTDYEKKYAENVLPPRIRIERKNVFDTVFTWKYFGIFSAVAGAMLVILGVVWKIKSDEREVERKRVIGRAKIGGEWELTNTEGKTEGSKELRGNWLLIYFGFTNCPDICPEQIEKMIEVIGMLNRENADLKILPIFISVDPARDNMERVRKYCAEFSPKLRGYTGTKEQVNNVAKAFRVYHSEGPRQAADKDDYIVDHTVIMYLVDPDGQFHDYYGQNRQAREIAEVIKSKAFMWNMRKEQEKSLWERIMKRRQKEEGEQKKAQKNSPPAAEQKTPAS